MDFMEKALVELKAMSDEDFAKMIDEFCSKQEPLGCEFSKVLADNSWSLYEGDRWPNEGWDL